MLIIFGKRSYGRIDAHGGEHAQTTFAHVYYMPIVPVSGFWVTQDLGSVSRGFAIAPSGKSIAAAYLRCWGPVAAFAALVTGSLAGVVVALACAAASVWAWSWRSLRGAAAHRESDFGLLAFGTRCLPERMPAELRAKAKADLDRRWAALDVKRPPDDVAEFGATSTREAVLAYGLLRLAAIDARGDARVRAAAAARRILDGAHDPAPAGDGPYRDDHEAAAPAIFDEVASAAGAAAAAGVQAAVVARRPVERGPWWQFSRGKALVAGIFALACIGMISVNGSALLGPRLLAGDEVATTPTGETFVAVRCDRLQSVGAFDQTPLYICSLGDSFLSVVGQVGLATPGTVVTGKLRPMSNDVYIWPDDLQTSPRVLPLYLDLQSRTTALVMAIGALAALAAFAALAGVWIRLAWRKRRRPAAG